MLKYTFFCSVLRSTHHHLTELIKVHGAGSILVQLINDPVQLLLAQRLQQLRDQPPQRVHRDEPLPIFVVDSESCFELPLEGLNVWVLNEELGAELTEFCKLNFSGSVFVDLFQDCLQLFRARPESHRSENLVKVIC